MISAAVGADELPATGSAVSGENDESVFVFPATLAQRRYWLLDKLQPGGDPALNMALPLHLRGSLDVDALRRALNAVVARHEALRTAFESTRGELRQLIATRVEIALPVQEGRERDDAIREEALMPFDLAHAPLLRARLLRFTEREHVLLLTVHHIVTDGWSNGILLRELWACYSAFLCGKEPSLPALEIQFADYAEWQHERLATDDFAWQREYWRQQLAGDLPVLDLPNDRLRTSGRDHSGASISRIIAPELIAAAKAFATREGASPFMLLLAVFEVLLHRYTGQADFVVTTPSANRQRQEFEALVGPLVNPLLLRADLRDDPTFVDLLGRVRRVVLDGFVNQDVPFESLLDEFLTARLQFNFLYQSAFVETTTLPSGLMIEPIQCASAGTVYELSASVLESAESVRLEFEYNSALFDAATIERMLGHYVTLLEGVIADPARKISTLPLLTVAERDQLAPRIETNETPKLDVRAPLLERVMAQTDAMAVRHGKREMSCAELLARMERARNVDQSGCPPSDLDQAAAWVAHWRSRVDTPPPIVAARSAEMERTIAAASRALRERAALQPGERIASFAMPGVAATEELGASLLSDTMLVYPTPELLADSAAALASWLERENIAVAFLPAATWNRLAAAFGRRVTKPAKLRLVVAAEGEESEGTLGRVMADPHGTANNGTCVLARRVVDAVGTVSIAQEKFPASKHVRVLDRRCDELLPIGIVGELAIVDQDFITRTGELARWLADGSLDQLGRTVDAISHRRVEAALGAISAVRHALVQTLTVGEGMNCIAYLWLKQSSGSLPEDDAVRGLLRANGLPQELLPAAFIRLKDFSLSPTDGRLDLAALPPPPSDIRLAMPEPVRPYLGLQLQLIAIWEEVLGVRGIGIRDDFFALGGNSLLAMRMLQRAESACGKSILPAALFANPTIEHLAGEMARDAIKEAPALLHVHDAGKRTPFFYLHGDLSGGGFYSLKLSRALGPDQPFYVLPPQDISALPAAPSIEEMAAAHLSALRAVRPHGPYVIGGFCVGGVIAYELARQLEASAEKVEMLLIIDAGPEDKTLRSLRSLAERSQRILRWSDDLMVARFGHWTIWRSRFAEWYRMNIRAKTRHAMQKVRQRFVSARGLLRASEKAAETEPDTTAANIALERDLPSAFLWACAGYHPQPYGGSVALLVSEDVLHAGNDLARDWRKVAPQVSVHPLTGKHLECITAHVDTLAATIESCLRAP